MNEQWDASSGLYYLRARYYDPASGRFVSRDPFPGLMRLPQTLNPYAYVTNNPVNLIDPSGEIPVLILAGLFVAGGFLGGAGAYTLYPYVYPDTCGRWDPAYALVWAGGGALLGAGMFGAGHGGWMLGVHFGWWTPAAGPLLGKSATDIYQRYADTTAAMLPQAQRTVSQGMTAVNAAGQRHHLLTRPVMAALNDHLTLSGVFQRTDPRLTYRARDLAAHIGYQEWHRLYSNEVVQWIQNPVNYRAAWQQFIQFLHDIHQEPWLSERIPGVDLRGWMP